MAGECRVRRIYADIALFRLVSEDMGYATNVYLSSYNNYPNRTTVRDVPAYDFYHGNFEIRQNITFKVVAEMFMNGRAAYSCKTFIPVNEVKNDGSARPYNWTYKDLRSAGYMNRYNY
ncbi:hypothetical protein SAMN04487828_1942 [Prevotella sp. lc2012]|nr:hypothetical protein SAMN04487828_1942 [Prevotella sp. lc2012]